MIDRERLLADCKSLVSHLEDDLRERLRDHPELDAPWREEYDAAREAGRTGAAYIAWLDENLTQVGAAWVLGCVFVRFLEDNGLVDEPRLSGPGERRRLALDHHLLYFRRHPAETDRDYLLSVFEEVAGLPGAVEVFDRRHNPLWRLGPSGDAARELLDLWQRRDATSGELAHDFTDPEWDTRFLGDLYQDLSEAARKRYALLQTPEFVESFILDRTLEPAIEEFGLEETRLLDPTCGSGHFLLGAFSRLVDRWLGAEPEVNVPELVQRALDAVVGVDVNPFAVAIARFRLLVAALQACNASRLLQAPGFVFHVVCGDSLLHGPRFGTANVDASRGVHGGQMTLDPADEPLRFVYETEDREMLREALGRRYTAVVGNPPYITVKDRALNQAYRDKYGSCSGKYSLAVPFFERFFELAEPGGLGKQAGFTGQITANSFMKREFGKKLVVDFVPLYDLTHVIDTSGAYIPGHGTPTVILLGRNRPPVKTSVRSVLGIRGEPETPEVPARGKVWQAILSGVDQPGYEDDFVSADDKSRELYGQHPWTLTGGGAVELKSKVDSASISKLRDQIDSIGVGAVTLEDDVYLAPKGALTRDGIEENRIVPFVEGDVVRDWLLSPVNWAILPYSDEALLPKASVAIERRLWPYRSNLRKRIWFRKTQDARGLAWFEYGHLSRKRVSADFLLTFAFVATHNHFSLDRGGKIFNRTAPVIKLPADATEDDHLALLGLLNSSVGCFWLKQVSHNKGATSDTGVLQDDPERFRFEFDGSKIKYFPIARFDEAQRELLCRLTRKLDSLGRDLAEFSFSSYLDIVLRDDESIVDAKTKVIKERDAKRHLMVRLQEELDWFVYQLYGIIEFASKGGPDLKAPPLEEQDRPYRLRGTSREPELEGVDRVRAEMAKSNKWIRLIERPEYKRRWFRSAGAYDANNLSDEILFDRQTREWLLDRLESDLLWTREPKLRSVMWIADRLREHPGALEVAEFYAGTDVDLTRLTADLLADAAVPYLAAWRYKPSGLRKRQAWEDVWAQQRLEDQGEDVGEIPVPPKYGSADFRSSTYWRLRGKLDVAKERFISYPGSERESDPTPVYGWAGWNQLQQAQALAAFYLRMKEDEGWGVERLTPLLGGLLELEPWIRQWYDSDQGQSGLGDYFKTFVDEEARDLGRTVEDVRGWRPPAKRRGRRKKRA